MSEETIAKKEEKKHPPAPSAYTASSTPFTKETDRLLKMALAPKFDATQNLEPYQVLLQQAQPYFDIMAVSASDDRGFQVLKDKLNKLKSIFKKALAATK